jgi:hypothetical protein
MDRYYHSERMPLFLLLAVIARHPEAVEDVL